MRLVIDGRRLTAERTGVGRYLETLLAAWAATGPPLPEALVVLHDPAGLARVPTAHGIRAEVVVPTLPGLLWERFGLGRRLRPGDLLFAPTNLLPSGWRGRSVLVLFDALMEARPGDFSRSTRWRFRARYRSAARRADVVVVPSEATARDAERYYGVPRDRIRVIHPAVDPTFRPPETDSQQTEPLPCGCGLDFESTADAEGSRGLEVETTATQTPAPEFLDRAEPMVGRHAHVLAGMRREAQARGTCPRGRGHATRDVTSPIDTPFWLVVGKRSRRRNLPAILDAFARHRRAFPTHRLVLAGPTAARVEAPGVLDLGHVAESTLADLFGSALGLLYLSEMEGFGLPVVEAMASGCPVLTLRRGALIESGGEAAVFLDEADPADMAAAMARLAVDPVWRADRVARGLAHAARFEAGSFAAAVTDELRRVASRPSLHP